ncbi:hypothetical protein CPter291_2249 [Collimonas pratensis]|uniref:Uncharacterized protein n=1 Tax=Collimonas pratensis TaxID=279113 RepID=A0A127QWW3_9BURK|nr:hypothetical protein CPter91_3129 [Collimonas pratensis]AMP14509.1 hypothetical protein CPter291_2249 [Collimonas pratensis]
MGTEGGKSVGTGQNQHGEGGVDAAWLRVKSEAVIIQC